MIFVPSGDQTGLLANVPLTVPLAGLVLWMGWVATTRRWFVPSAFITQMSPLDPSCPTSPLSKVIFVPSGDQSGAECCCPHEVSCVSCDPSVRTLKIACRQPSSACLNWAGLLPGGWSEAL